MKVQTKHQALSELNRLGLDHYRHRVHVLPVNTVSMQEHHIEDWLVRMVGDITVNEKR